MAGLATNVKGLSTRARRIAVILVVSLGVGLVGLSALICGLWWGTTRTGTDSRQLPELLYATASGLDAESGPARIEAARRLAMDPDAAPWLILMFLSSQANPVGDPDEHKAQKGLRLFDLGVVAVVLEALPERVPPEVLWAITYLLDEGEQGVWSEERGAIIVRKTDRHSGPIRELARRRLIGYLGVDHGWNAAAWRAAIAGRSVKAPVDKNAHSPRSTQPRSYPELSGAPSTSR